MRHATAKHQSGEGQADQSGGPAAQTISVRFKSDRGLEKGGWDLAASGVSLCARSEEAWKSRGGSRSARSGGSAAAGEYEQARAAFETERQREHQWDYGQVAGGLSETAWDVRIANGARSFGMNLTAY